MIMKKNILLTLAVALMPIWAFAQTSAALPFLRINRDAKTGAMGGVEAVSGLYNPAAVPFTGSDVALSYQIWAPGGAKSNNINLMAGIKLGKRIGLNVMGAYQMGTEYPIIDAAGNSKSTFKPSDLMAGVGFGFAITDFLSVGLNAKFASSTLAADAKYTAFAGDAFVMFAKKGFKASLGVASLGTPVKSGEDSYALPASVKAGAGYTAGFGKSAVDVAADFDYFFVGGMGLGLGAQYAWNDMVFVRAGFHLGSGNAPLPSYGSVGLGFKIVGVHLDVSYLLGNAALGNTLTVGLGYAF